MRNSILSFYEITSKDPFHSTAVCHEPTPMRLQMAEEQGNPRVVPRFIGLIKLALPGNSWRKKHAPRQKLVFVGAVL
jgi:hypothetical protein